MEYQEYIPTGELRQHVVKIWSCRSADFRSSGLTLPLLHPELVFNFSDSYGIVNTADPAGRMENPLAWIQGIQSGACYSHCSGRHDLTGVLFTAGGLKAFLSYHADEFAGQFIDAASVFGSQVTELAEQLRNTPAPVDRFALIGKFLVTRLQVDDTPAYLRFSLMQIPGIMGSKGSVGDICRKASISNKTLIRSFKKHIGVSPKHYSHLVVINKALMLLEKDPRQSFTRLAHRLNFYDQAHFNTLFRSVTSLTPSVYTDYVINGKVDPSCPNFIFPEG